ncbi:MAG: lipid-A-disaccharide synthase [Alloprevotella sp.]|nr:lipid-A-disaccharide synthase [Alloprevotella sp.]
MKYFLIAGEASGDLHAANLMHALRAEDPQADFRFYGGDRMQAEAGRGLLCHYRNLAYMGIIPVLRHLPQILRGMRRCKAQIEEYRPDALILVDYPGFNLSIARHVHRLGICPVFYYISPKIWAWKEGRIHRIRRDVDALFSILPFEVDYFGQRHGYPVTYVGNPTVDEVAAYEAEHGQPCPQPDLIALLPGSRRQEVKDNLRRMLRATNPLVAEGGHRIAIAAAPALPRSFYEKIIAHAGVERGRIELVEDDTYALLSRAGTALVTSGTATLEAALFRVPQIVCYYISFGPLVRLLRRLLLKVPYISLVNLIAGEEVVPELVADRMNVKNLQQHLREILPGGSRREKMLEGYARTAMRLGKPGAPRHAARAMLERLRAGGDK